MNNIKDFPTTNYDSFFQRVYFTSIINNIISFGELRDTNKKNLYENKFFEHVLHDKKHL